MEFETKLIKVNDLELDPENPRFCHLALAGRKLTSQEDLMEEIEKDKEIIKLSRAIRKSGVKDPIWIKKKESGKYLVLEGNRRTVVLKNLLKENIEPPEEVRYDIVKANVISPKTSKTEELLQKARLQAGKKEWGAFNEAAVVYILRNEYFLEIEDIATEMQISMKEVERRLENYDFFTEYSKNTGDDNPGKYSFFGEAPKQVRDWFSESKANRMTYYQLITPKKGVQKIRSVATKGGLRDFSKVLDVPEALDYLIETDGATVDDALEIAKDIDIMKDIPFIKRISPLASQLNQLSETQIEKIKNDIKITNSIKQLQRAINYVLEKMEEG